MNAAIEKKKGNPYHVSTGFKGYLKNPVLTLMFLPVVIYYIVFMSASGIFRRSGTLKVPMPLSLKR